VYKFRKEISKTAEEGKGFVLRQTENLKNLLAETPKNAEEKDAIK
jgi:hypothetical protein